MRGKYSPTVVEAYRRDQRWHEKYIAGPGVVYDPEGYDSYGYDVNDVDRAGNNECAYYSDDYDGENWAYNDALEVWGFDGVKPVEIK